MTESFSQLFKKSIKEFNINPGSIINGTVMSIKKDIVFVDVGLKSESAIPIEQFNNIQGKLEIKVGDKVNVFLESIEDGFGETLLSREKAKRHESWVMLEEAYENEITVTGVITGKVKGGFTVELNGIHAFLPGSLVDVRPIRENLHLEGKKLEFKVIKLDKKRNNIVVSRKIIIESENIAERNQLLKNLKEKMKIKGIIKNLTDYGAFVDLGGIDGLLHITDMAWKRVKHPSEIVNIGDEIIVKILKFDREKTRVSLGLKQLSEDPWMFITKRYPEGNRLTGKITNITDYGCFVEIEEGIEGLVHISEMDWIKKNIHPSKLVNIGEKIEVMVLNIDEERRRISLGLKQCKINPWKQFSKINNKGDKVEGKIKSITDFGIFIGLDGGIDGLVHLSDISWEIPGEEAIRKYKKGDKILTILLQVDSERERISLGIKQLYEDPFNNYLCSNKKGDIVKGIVKKIEEKSAIIKLSNEIEGHLSIENISTIMNINDNIQVKIIGFDKKNRIVNLSIYFEHIINKKETIKNINNKNKDNKFSNAITEAFKAANKD